MRSWYQRLLPSPMLAAVYFVIASAALLISSYGRIVNELVDPATQDAIRKQIADNFSLLIETTFSSSDTMATIVSFIFWLAIASLAYLVVWLVAVFFRDIFNEIELSLIFVHPRSFSESKHWVGFASRYLLRAAILLFLAGYGVICAYVLWPAIASEFSVGITNLSLESIAKQVIPSLLLALISMHVFVLLVQLFLWRRSADYWRDHKTGKVGLAGE